MTESRVKDTIIDSGWTEGFKSVFYSPAKIRRLEQEKAVSAFAAEKEF